MWTMSIGPRTEAPIRTSEWSRVARPSPTASRTSRPDSPVALSVIVRSPASSW